MYIIFYKKLVLTNLHFSYKYLEYRGKRNCKECGVLFWDKPMNDKDSQDLDKSYCKKHIHLKENEKLLKKLQK